MVSGYTILGLLTICHVMYIGFWVQYRRYIKPQEDTRNSIFPPISVVICYKNEENNIGSLAQTLANQKYAQFEVIFVDDFSTDDSTHILINALQIAPFPYILKKATIDRPGKKQALMEGISAAQYDYILVTDGDCAPMGDQWISRMAQSIDENFKGIVLGYGPFYAASTTVNNLARYMGTMTACQYFTLAQMGLAYMGVGRNMLYHRSNFKQSIFENTPNLISGDDDLLVSAQAKHVDVRSQWHNESFMYSTTPSTLKSYIQQRLRHISTSWHYSPMQKIILGLWGGMHTLWIPLSLIIMIWYPQLTAHCLALIGLRWGIVYSLMEKPFLILNASDLRCKWWWLDVCFAIEYILLILLYPVSNRKKW